MSGLETDRKQDQPYALFAWMAN